MLSSFRYGTVCSGIEAPTVAWGPLGWESQWFSEIEPFPKAALANHYPNVPDLGDMTKVNWNEQANIDVLIGGTPCQSFSIAGLRKGLADPRGNLALEFLRIVDTRRPRWFVWENVPGVLSSNGGRDFGAFLGAVVKLGYGFAYRILDAQNFGVPQRRRRVFVVGYSGSWPYPTAVLFNAESLQGGLAPGKKTKDNVACLTACGVGTCGADDNQAQAGHLIYSARVASPLGASPSTTWSANVANGQGTVVAFDVYNQAVTGDVSKTICARNDQDTASVIAFHPRQTPVADGVAMPCETSGPMGVATGAEVRRLTPVECERLQGFPDNYTRIPWRGKPAEACPDSHRYKALGNSMAVPVVRWIGERIMEVENAK